MHCSIAKAMSIVARKLLTQTNLT